jgi:hypothetical protein
MEQECGLTPALCESCYAVKHLLFARQGKDDASCSWPDDGESFSQAADIAKYASRTNSKGQR